MRRWFFCFILALAIPILPLAAASQQPLPAQAGFPRAEPSGPLAFGGPIVVNLDGDSDNEILLGDGSGCVWGWSAAGVALPNFPLRAAATCNGSSAVQAPLAVGDIDGDGGLEIVAGTRGSGPNAGQRGNVWAWHADGTPVAGWPKEMAWSDKAGGAPAIASIALADLAGDSALEVVYGTTNNANNGQIGFDIAQNLYARTGAGALVPVFPTWAGTAGIYGGLAVGSLHCGSSPDVVAGRDHGYLHAYDGSGRALEHWPVRTYVTADANNPSTDLYLAFPNSAPALGDIDGHGRSEIVALGLIRDPAQGNATIGSGLLVLDAAGTRQPGWELPKAGGPPPANAAALPALAAPVLADLDGAAGLEIVAPFPDGVLRVFRNDGALLWSYAYGNGLQASEPVIGDVTGDGQPDIVFGVYSPDGSANAAAGVIGLNRSGQPLANFPLPLTQEENAPIQGVRATPSLADLDGDGDLEIAAASISGTLYVWTTGAAANAALPWPTARHDIWRSGAATGGPRPVFAPGPRGPNKLWLPFFQGC